MTHALKGEGHDASEDGTGRGVPLTVMGTLSASDGGVSGKDAPQVIAFDETQITSAENRSNPRPGDPCHPMNSSARPPAIAYRTTGNDGAYETGDKVGALNTGTDPNANVIGVASAVRRLTPRECERLQGFPDGYTLVPFRSKPAADGPRYKALGNSIAVPCLAHIGTRLARALGIDRYRDTDIASATNRKDVA